MTTQNRPTRVFKTQHGDHTVTLYTYLTAREKTAIDSIVAEGTTLSQDPKANADQKIPALTLMRMVNKLVETVVAEVDGDKNGFEVLENLPSQVMDEVKTEVQKVYDDAINFHKGV